MVRLSALCGYCDELLRVAGFDDYCPNGLQVEGRPEVRRLLSGVSASQALIEAAIDWQADALLVHHGHFWKGEPAVVTGIRRRRLAALLGAELSLLAYHLPLDAHPDLGNNVQLARHLGWRVGGVAAEGPHKGLLWWGQPATPATPGELAEDLGRRLARPCLHVPGRAPVVQTLAWCTGGAQGLLAAAVDLGVDAYLTGEVSEPTVLLARESGVHFYAAGHHATERYGVQALGAHLADRFGLEHRFVDIDNPA